MAFLLGDKARLDDVTDRYYMQKIIGRGTFAVVRKCKSLETGEHFACKTINKHKVKKLNYLKREIEILADVNHPNIVRLYDVYEEETKIHLIMELCTGGELYDRIVEKSNTKQQCFTEVEAAGLMQKILSIVTYCHDVKNVVHRDLKVENFLFLNKRDDSPIKTIDFGLSRYSADEMRSRVGTVCYVAPEVLHDSYTTKCDIWSCGIIAYVLLCGFLPFYDESERRTLRLVKNAELEFPSPNWDKTSEGAKSFVKSLLDRDPEVRPSAKEALQHPWLQLAQPPEQAPVPKASSMPEISPTEPKKLTRRRDIMSRFLVMVNMRKEATE